MAAAPTWRGADYIIDASEVRLDGLFGRNRLLGSGAHGQIYAGTYKGQKIAQKTLFLLNNHLDGGRLSENDRNFVLDCLRRECVILSRINSPNIVRFFGMTLDRRGNPEALIMEQLEPFSTIYHPPTPLEPLWWWTCAFHVLFGLDALANTQPKPTVHRDLKPDNLLVTPGPDRTFKLADLGLARDGLSRTLTLGVGSPAYMAPELRDEGATPSTAIDRFSFGVCMMELALGEPPNPTGETRRGTVVPEHERRAVHILRLEAVGSNIANMVKACIRDAPAERPTLGELKSALLCEPLWNALRNASGISAEYRLSVLRLLVKVAPIVPSVPVAQRNRWCLELGRVVKRDHGLPPAVIAESIPPLVECGGLNELMRFVHDHQRLRELQLPVCEAICVLFMTAQAQDFVRNNAANVVTAIAELKATMMALHISLHETLDRLHDIASRSLPQETRNTIQREQQTQQARDQQARDQQRRVEQERRSAAERQRSVPLVPTNITQSNNSTERSRLVDVPPARSLKSTESNELERGGLKFVALCGALATVVLVIVLGATGIPEIAVKPCDSRYTNGTFIYMNAEAEMPSLFIDLKSDACATTCAWDDCLWSSQQSIELIPFQISAGPTYKYFINNGSTSELNLTVTVNFNVDVNYSHGRWPMITGNLSFTVPSKWWYMCTHVSVGFISMRNVTENDSLGGMVSWAQVSRAANPVASKGLYWSLAVVLTMIAVFCALAWRRLSCNNSTGPGQHDDVIHRVLLRGAMCSIVLVLVSVVTGTIAMSVENDSTAGFASAAGVFGVAFALFLPCLFYACGNCFL